LAGSGASLALASFRWCDRGVIWLPGGMARWSSTTKPLRRQV